MTQFLAMGGFAQFVWPAYAVSLFVLGGLVGLSLRRYRAAARALGETERRR